MLNRIQNNIQASGEDYHFIGWFRDGVLLKVNHFTDEAIFIKWWNVHQDCSYYNQDWPHPSRELVAGWCKRAKGKNDFS